VCAFQEHLGKALAIYPDIYQDIDPRAETMATAAQIRAIKSYRQRMRGRGMVRFEVMAQEEDRELLRELAKKLAVEGREAEALRRSLETLLAEDRAPKGGILAALRRSPLVEDDAKNPLKALER